MDETPYLPKLATQLACSCGSLIGPHSLLMRLARKLPFAFDDANSRGGPKEWLARIRGGSVPWDNEAIAGLEAVLTELEARRARQKRSRGHR